MKRIVEVLFVVALAFTVIGCATAQLPKDATIEQKAAAKAQDCQAAKDSYVLADQMLNSPGMDAEATKYWNTYKVGAQLGITVACGSSAVPAAPGK